MSAAGITAPPPLSAWLAKGLWLLAFAVFAAAIYYDFTHAEPEPVWFRFVVPLAFAIMGVSFAVDPRQPKPAHGDALEDPEAAKPMSRRSMAVFAFLPLVLEVFFALVAAPARESGQWWPAYIAPAAAIIVGVALAREKRSGDDGYWTRGWAAACIVFAIGYLVILWGSS